MLQEIHLAIGSLQITSNSILLALHSLQSRETRNLMTLDTCRDLHMWGCRPQHPDFVHASDCRSA
eukprot:12921149-Prorocentrum_lima.AAC.1